jgi:two-component system NtrC family sensor kinase
MEGQSVMTTHLRKKRCVLLVDDDPLVLRATSRVLRRAYEVTAVSAASHALDLLSAGARFDAVVCDVVMPEQNGWEFYRRVRHVQPEFASRIIFVSGGGPVSLMERIEALPNLLLKKPVSAPVLMDAIERAIAGNA